MLQLERVLMKTARRAGVLGFAAFTLAGCIPATTTGAPIVSASLVTPSTPMVYAWVMVYDGATPRGNGWGVQIGPKVDASGTHVAVYGWQDCSGSPCAWEFFHAYQTLEPGSVHDYAITWTAGGWALSCDGVVLATLNPGSSNATTQVGSEVTTQ